MLGSMAVWMRILGTAQWLLDETGSAYWVGFIGVVQLLVRDTNDVVGRDTGRPVGQKAAHDLLPWSSGCHISCSGCRQCGWPIATSNDVCGIAMLAGRSDARRTRAVALLPIIVPKKDLMSAVSTDTAFSNAAAILGPLLFAGVALSAGLTTVFLLAGLIALTAGCLPLLSAPRSG